MLVTIARSERCCSSTALHTIVSVPGVLYRGVIGAVRWSGYRRTIQVVHLGRVQWLPFYSTVHGHGGRSLFFFFFFSVRAIVLDDGPPTQGAIFVLFQVFIWCTKSRATFLPQALCAFHERVCRKSFIADTEPKTTEKHRLITVWTEHQ